LGIIGAEFILRRLLFSLFC